MTLTPAAGPTSALPPFAFSAFMRVAFDETDAQGVVYYGRYPPYFDRARIEYLRHLELLRSLPAGQEFVMRRSTQQYDAPARFDDPLEVYIRTAKIGRTSMTFEFRALHAIDGTSLAIADQVMVLIDAPTRTPVEISEAWRERIERFEGRR